MTPLETRLSPARLWRSIPFLAAGAALLLIADSALRLGAVEPRRLKLAACVWFPLAAFALAARLCPDRWLPASLRRDNAETAADAPWMTALLLSFGVATVGLLVSGLLMLHPPRIASSVQKTWEYTDKRWLLALYLLGVGLVYLPGVLQRLLGIAPAGGPEVAEGTIPVLRGGPGQIVIRAVAAILVGSALAVVYVAPIAPGALGKVIDSHELMHLGSLQRMAQGATPYVDARTQYGPGHQIVMYRLMRSAGFTLLGFRTGHLVLNLVTVAAIFSLVLFAFGWLLGAGAIVAALLVSPLQITTFVGWGVLVRWFAPLLVGALAPLVLWGRLGRRGQITAFALLGAASGTLAWVSQENGGTSILTLAFVLAAAMICRDLPLRSAAALAGAFLLAALVTFVALMAWLVGPERLIEAIGLYRNAVNLVVNGMTNTPWANAELPWARPPKAFRVMYLGMPYVVIALTALALYPPRRSGRLGGGARAGQLLGMAAAAGALGLMTLMRSDSPRVVGCSMAIPGLVVLSLAYLPERLFAERRGQLLSLAVLGVVFLGVFPFFRAYTDFRFRVAVKPERTVAGLRALRDAWGAPPPTESPVLARLGYRPDLDAPCCRFSKLSIHDWEETLGGIRAAVGERPVVVDSRGIYSVLSAVTSTVYFLADLKVGTAFVDPMMTVWVDDDVAAAKAEFLEKKPGCLVTGESGFLLKSFVLEQWRGKYTEVRIPGKVPAIVVCRTD